MSFAVTPLSEISAKVEEIAARGWEYRDRGDPWSAVFRKYLPESDKDPEAELREIMGDYWMSAEDIRAFRASK